MHGELILLFPVFFPMAAALLGYLIGRKTKAARDWFVILAGLAELAVLAFTALTTLGQTLEAAIDGFCALGIRFVLDDFRRIYALVAAFMWAMTLLFSRQYFAHYRNRNRYYFFNLMTLGATLGVFLSADLFTTFIFFEVMSFTSYVWVAHEENPAAMRAANTYLAVAVIGGLVALMGLFLLWKHLGTLAIDSLYAAAAACENRTVLYLAGGCLLVGFGAKAGMFPLHIWLPKAHPVAPAPASALLSGILTKSGVFGMLAVSCNIFRYDPKWGTLILTLGVITMVLGALLAVFSIDLKRTLACSSMSQIGFIAVGIGMMGLLGAENALAARGVVLHMMNHSLIKLVLFMAAGVVYVNLHKLDLNEIRGFGRKKPLLNVCFLMGALGIGGIPLWNGYISKTLLHEAIVEYAVHLSAHGGNALLIRGAEWLFLFSGGLTLAYMTKLYIALFVEKHPTRQKEFDAMKNYVNIPSAIALSLSALVLPILGMMSGVTMDRIADLSREFFAAELPAHAVHYFTWTNLKGAVISIVIGAAVYLLIVRPLLRKQAQGTKSYVNVWPSWLDLEDLIYRPLILRWLPGVFGWICALFGENRLLAPLCVKLVQAGGVAFRVVSELPDAAVVLLRGTIFRDAKEPEEDKMRRSPLYHLGAFLDRIFPRKAGAEPRGVHLVNLQRSLQKTTELITGNLSFALLMCCIGLCLLLLYLVFLH